MKTDLLVTKIKKQFEGYGHNKIAVFVTGKLINDCGENQDVKDYKINCISNNTVASDCFFDDSFDENPDNEGFFYETRYEAGESLVNEVFRKNNIQSDYEIKDVPTPDEVRELRSESN